MPDRKSKRSRDPNVRAWQVVQEATEERACAEPSPAADAEAPEEKKNPHAVALGRLGGKKGGKARAAKLTAEQRSEIAKIAARARWKKESEDS